MISYIVKSGLCLALIWAIYKLLLERERMYEFNRYYLLFGLIFSLLIPFASITTYETVASLQETVSTTAAETSELVSLNETPQTLQGFSWRFWLAIVYGIGALFLLIRFGVNLWKILKKVTQNMHVFYKQASLVLLKENVMPHSFLRYIFLEEKAHFHQQIAEDLYTHELAHVQQKHSLDIIFIELIQSIFWFNPIVIFYKKAIQLNHEFLADQAVLNTTQKVATYQELLLENMSGNRHFRLASNFNFSITKKRLQMMTKHTSNKRAWLVASLTVPVFIAAFFIFSTKVSAQKIQQQSTETIASKKIAESRKAIYYQNATFVVKDATGSTSEKSYEELSEEEQQKLLPAPTKITANSPSESVLNDFKDSQKFAIWLDGIVTANDQIEKHTIVHYTQSFVHKNARSNKFPQPYQVQLYTKEGFEKLQNQLEGSLSEGATIHLNTSERSSNVSKDKVSKNKTDMVIMINKSGRFLVNYEHLCDFKELDKFVKIELDKITHKNARTATIIHQENQQDLVGKVRVLLNKFKIYQIYTLDAEYMPPPPPPALTTEEKTDVEIMHKLVKGQNLKTMMINGKKHFYFVKDGRTFIFNEESKLVNVNGEPLPPPPPAPPKPEKPVIKKVKTTAPETGKKG